MWFLSGTVSGSYAACVSGSEFLFPPNTNAPGVPCVAQLSLEDHSQTVDATRGLHAPLRQRGGEALVCDAASELRQRLSGTVRRCQRELERHASGAHDLRSRARPRTHPGRAGEDQGLGLSLQVLNVLNHQYLIKVANGFNTTQIANGTSVLLRLTAPFTVQK